MTSHVERGGACHFRSHLLNDSNQSKIIAPNLSVNGALF